MAELGASGEWLAQKIIRGLGRWRKRWLRLDRKASVAVDSSCRVIGSPELCVETWNNIFGGRGISLRVLVRMVRQIRGNAKVKKPMVRRARHTLLAVPKMGHVTTH